MKKDALFFSFLYGGGGGWGKKGEGGGDVILKLCIHNGRLMRIG